jgi:hypothetical protein
MKVRAPFVTAVMCASLPTYGWAFNRPPSTPGSVPGRGARDTIRDRQAARLHGRLFDIQAEMSTSRAW